MRLPTQHMRSAAPRGVIDTAGPNVARSHGVRVARFRGYASRRLPSRSDTMTSTGSQMAGTQRTTLSQVMSTVCSTRANGRRWRLLLHGLDRSACARGRRAEEPRHCTDSVLSPAVGFRQFRYRGPLSLIHNTHPTKERSHFPFLYVLHVCSALEPAVAL